MYPRLPLRVRLAPRLPSMAKACRPPGKALGATLGGPKEAAPRMAAQAQASGLRGRGAWPSWARPTLLVGAGVGAKLLAMSGGPRNARWWCLLTPYLLGLSAAVHFRFPAPIGQVSPFPDPLLVYVEGWSPGIFFLWLAAIMYKLFCYEHDWYMLDWYVLGMLVLGAFLTGRAGQKHEEGANQLVEAFESIGIEVASGNPRTERPRRPWFTWPSPYLYWFCSQLDGLPSPSSCSPAACAPTVRVQRLRGEVPNTFVDLWLRSEAAPTTGGGEAPGRPVFFFVHGGGWRAGEARANAQAPLLHMLAANGWFVVSCEYRKRQWPQHLEDVVAGLEWVCGPRARSLGADCSRLVVAGTSAGGHIVTLATNRALRHHRCPYGIRGVVLFYPAVDPLDSTGATARWPLGDLPLLRLHRHQSLLAWFFERAVLCGDAEKWTSAQPLAELEEEEFASRWPPVLVIHGDKDSVVPREHSHRLLAILAARERSGGTAEEGARDVPKLRKQDAFISVPGGRHTYDLAASSVSDIVFEGVAEWCRGAVEGAGTQRSDRD